MEKAAEWVRRRDQMEKTKRPNTKLKDAVGEIEGKIGGYKTKSQREGEDIKVQVMPFT